jgi:hypothetical protein
VSKFHIEEDGLLTVYGHNAATVTAAVAAAIHLTIHTPPAVTARGMIP